jgi:hypothetical protein
MSNLLAQNDPVELAKTNTPIYQSGSLTLSKLAKPE